jgi:hypothetical protein
MISSSTFRSGCASCAENLGEALLYLRWPIPLCARNNAAHRSAPRSTPALLRDAPVDEEFLELPQAPEGEGILGDSLW